MFPKKKLHHYYYIPKKAYICPCMTTSILHQLKFQSKSQSKFWQLPVFNEKIILLLGLFLTLAEFALGQVRNFTKNEYQGGTQNWAMAQDEYSRLYVANNEGLLVYDGTNWRLHTVPNKTIVRSIVFGADGKLYAGAQDELGYYAPDVVGKLQFTSLKQLLPAEDRNFTDVWQIVATDHEVFFRTDTKIFKLHKGKITTYLAKSIWLSIHKHQGQILAHDKQEGLLAYQNEQWQSFLPIDALPTNLFITDLIPYQKGMSLLSTVSHGLYILEQKELKPYPLKNSIKEHFTTLRILPDSNFLMGTYLHGVYKIAPTGEIIDNISTQHGMLNNTVRCLFTHARGGVWVGLDNGLSFFNYNSAITHINPLIFNNGAGYDAKILDDHIYFALSTGLVALPASTTHLHTAQQEAKTILNGLTWNLSVVENQLLAGRDDGLFAIKDQQARPISSATGYWSCLPLPQTTPLQVIAGNYTGVDFFELKNKTFTQVGKVEKFKESSRYIETDGTYIWVSHPYRGIYSIALADKSVRLYSQKEGLPTNLDNHVFKIKGKIVFATPKGVYEYNASAGKFIKSLLYKAVFGDKPIRYLKEDAQGNIWFVQEKMLGVVDFRAGKPTLRYIPELKNKIVSGFENIFPHNSRNILVGGETGFYQIDYEKYVENIQPFSVYVSGVKTSGAVDSVLFGGYTFGQQAGKNPITVPYNLNSLVFSYASSAHEQPYPLEYSYYLEGFDTAWSEWNTHIEKEYTNLPAGTYTFQVKARKSPSHESSVGKCTFIVRPPWYQTIWAYMLYVLLAVSFLLGVLRYQAIRYKRRQEAKRLADLQKFEEEQKQLAYQHQLELAKSENEITHLQNEKLDAEIKHKNAELANATMTLVQKKEFILKLKKELQQLQKSIKVGEDSTELKKLLKILAEEEKLDEEWDSFSLHFNSVHGDFLTILKKRHTTLNPHDLRLCAYLRMNLSSKEIAPLLGISLRGVEISRYRLRKKLSLPTEMNLVEYLLNLDSEKVL
jgi:DNA-binding CsgD family transcriptional regulator